MNHADDVTGPPVDPAVNRTTLHVQGAIRGEVASLSWIVARLTPLLLAQAEYRLGARLRRFYDPEDLVQDAWVVAFPRLPELGTRDGRHTPVLLRFLTTTLLYRINELARRHLRSARTPGVDASEVRAASAELPAETSGAITHAVRNEQQEAVRACLRELDRADREVLLLRGVEQQPYRLVAAALGSTVAAVTMRYRRALERLRSRLPASVFDELQDE